MAFNFSKYIAQVRALPTATPSWQQTWNEGLANPDAAWTSWRDQTAAQSRRLFGKNYLPGFSSSIDDHGLEIFKTSPTRAAFEAHYGEWGRQHQGGTFIQEFGGLAFDIGLPVAGFALGGPAGAAAGSSLAAVSRGENLEGVLKAGALGYAGGELASAFGGAPAGIDEAAAVDALSSGVSFTGGGAASLGTSASSELLSGALMPAAVPMGAGKVAAAQAGAALPELGIPAITGATSGGFNLSMSDALTGAQIGSGLLSAAALGGGGEAAPQDLSGARAAAEDLSRTLPRDRGVETREQVMKRRAQGASVTRLGNMADMLGMSNFERQRGRAGARRSIVGP